MKTEKEIISDYKRLIGARGGAASGALKTPAQVKARRSNIAKARMVKGKYAASKRKLAK